MQIMADCRQRVFAPFYALKSEIRGLELAKFSAFHGDEHRTVT